MTRTMMTSPPKFTRRLDVRLAALFYECFRWVDMRSSSSRFCGGAMGFVVGCEFLQVLRISLRILLVEKAQNIVGEVQ